MRSPPRLLVTGAEGQVGWELARALLPIGEVTAVSRAELDITDGPSVARLVERVRPAIVCNAAAYTAVDRAQTEESLARQVNGEAPGILGEVAQRNDCAVVHFSTDYVFDGKLERPYVETDSPAPLSVYGATKLEGERALADSGAAHVTFRTSWVYAARGSNFLRTMLRMAREKEELRVVADQRGAPTWARWLAEAVAQIVGRAARDTRGPTAWFYEVGGVVHLTSKDATSWHGFAEAILSFDPSRSEQRAKRVVPITTAEYPTPAVRPRQSVLDSRLAAERFGVSLTPWREQLRLAMNELAPR